MLSGDKRAGTRTWLLKLVPRLRMRDASPRPHDAFSQRGSEISPETFLLSNESHVHARYSVYFNVFLRQTKRYIPAYTE